MGLSWDVSGPYMVPMRLRAMIVLYVYPWDSHGASMGFPWDLVVFSWGSRGTLVGLPWDFHGTQGCSHGNLMGLGTGLIWDFHRTSIGTPMGLPWCLHETFMGLPGCFSHRNSIELPRDYSAPIRIPRDNNGTAMRLPLFPWDSMRLWYTHGVSVGLPWCSDGAPMGLAWDFYFMGLPYNLHSLVMLPLVPPWDLHFLPWNFHGTPRDFHGTPR